LIHFESDIDRLAYHLYGLTEEEFKIVDPEMPIIKEKCKKKDI
jgi:hypothetical protein